MKLLGDDIEDIADRRWALEDRLPPVNGNVKRGNCVMMRQTLSTRTRKGCAISVGDSHLDSFGQSWTIRFTPNTSPFQHSFDLEFIPDLAKTEKLKQPAEDVIMARFSAHVALPGDYRYPNKPFTYGGLAIADSSPLSEFTFSAQLRDVRFRRGDRIRDQSSQSFGKPPQELADVQWSASSFTRLGWSRSLSRYDTQTISAAGKFKAILDRMVDRKEMIRVRMIQHKEYFTSIWPRFASLPQPSPPSYWPWLHHQQEYLLKMMVWAGPYRCEVSKQYVDAAMRYDLAKDSSSSYSPGDLISLPQVTQFTDNREYVAHILAAHAYEESHTQQLRSSRMDGEHACDIVRLSSGACLVLLNINIPPPTDSEKQAASEGASGSAASKPEPNERCSIEVDLVSANGTQFNRETWHGKVVEPPPNYTSRAWNTCIFAWRPTAPAMYPIPAKTTTAIFQFGHAGASLLGLRRSVLEFMFNDTHAFPLFRNMILAQDNFDVAANSIHPQSNGVTLTWDDIVKKFITPRGLNQEQTDFIRTYLQQRFTLLVGPPGTGKSTLIDAIVAIEESFGNRIMLCADSNAAVDVLANKYTARKGNQPGKAYRLRTSLEETMAESPAAGGTSGIRTFPGFTPAPTTANVLEIHRTFGAANISPQTLSLGVEMRRRLDAKCPPPAFFPGESAAMQKLSRARSAISGYKPDPSRTKEQQANDLQELQVEELSQLRNIQQLYVGKANVIFSTASKLSSSIMRKIKPQVVVIDECSQMQEAKTAHIISHVCREGEAPYRILLVGDHNQLPPTITAEHNPMEETARVSMFERLIKAGTPYMQLTTQYRSHPQISASYSKLIYNSHLQDHSSTSMRPSTIAFSDFARSLLPASNALKKTNEHIASLVLSVTQQSQLPWGSQQRPNSTSRVNFQSAIIVILAALDLIEEDIGFDAKDIMVTTFYRDQLNLLRFLASKFTFLNGLRLMTVDGSQGEESEIQIIDCVVLGGKVPGGAGDTLGFLGTEKRRFNVALSRAKAGRLLVGHALMGKYAKVYKGVVSVWDEFMDMEKRAGHIVETTTYMESRWKDPACRTLLDAVQAYRASGTSQTQELAIREATLKARPRPDVSWLVTKLVDDYGVTKAQALLVLDKAGGNYEDALAQQELIQG